MKLHKKAFTMIELVFVIIAIGILSMSFYSNNEEEKKADKINEMYTLVYEIIDKSIFNAQKGYVSEIGGNCSSSYDTRDITAEKVYKCAHLNLNNFVNDSSDDTSAGSYFFFLKDLGTCKVYFGSESDFGLKVTLDCSTLTYGNKGKIEQTFASTIRQKSNISFTGIYPEATSVLANSGGTKSDGIVTIVLTR